MKQRLIDANELRKNLSSRYMNELYPDWRTLPELTKMRIEILAKEFRFALDHAITINATPVEYAQWEKPHGMMPPEYHHRSGNRNTAPTAARRWTEVRTMAEYHVSAGMFGIYAGTLMPKKDGEPQMWRNKSDVTDEAICAVRDYMTSECLNEKEGKIRGGYEWTRKDGKKVLLIVEIEDGGAE